MNDDENKSSSTTPISILDFLNDQYESNSKNTIDKSKTSELGVIYESNLDDQKNIGSSLSKVESSISKGSLVNKNNIKNINETNDDGISLEKKLSFMESIKQSISSVIGKISGTTVDKAAVNTLSHHKQKIEPNGHTKLNNFSANNEITKNEVCKDLTQSCSKEKTSCIQTFQTSVTKLMDQLCNLQHHEPKTFIDSHSTSRKINKPKIESEKWDQSDPCVPFMTFDQFNFINDTKFSAQTSIKPSKSNISLSSNSDNQLSIDLKPTNHSISKKSFNANTCSKKSERNMIELIKEVECLLKKNENSSVTSCIDEKDLMKNKKIKNKAKTIRKQVVAENVNKSIKKGNKEKHTRSEKLSSCLDDVTKNLNKMSHDLGLIMNNINSMDFKSSKKLEKTSSTSSYLNDSDSYTSIQSISRNFSSDKRPRENSNSKGHKHSYFKSKESKKTISKSNRKSINTNDQILFNRDNKKEIDYFLSKDDVDENILKQNNLFKTSSESDDAKWVAENSPLTVNRMFTITIKATHKNKRKNH